MTVDVVLDYRPREWQRQCHAQRQRFTVLALHRRAGKTELAIMELLDKALRSQLPLPLFVYVAPFLKQAKAIAWARLKQRVEPLKRQGVVDVNEGELSMTFLGNSAVVRLFGADNPDALRGMRLDGVVVDEVAQVAPEVWNDILQPALSDRKGWALFIGTPAGINLFSELYYDAQSKPDWHAARYTVYDTDALDPGEVERLRNGGMPEQSFAREYLCDFSAAGDDQVIPLADAEAAAHRTYLEREVAGAARVIGVDPARFGDDRSVIVKRHGLKVYPLLVFRGIDNMDLASRVAAEIQDWEPDAVFIDSGGGAGVIDRLRQLGFVVMEVAFGGRPTNPALFANRRTEMWIAMRDWLIAGGSIPNDTVLKQELATPIYWFDPQGRRVLEPKEEIKKRLQGGASPDIADALALTFASAVQHVSREQAMRQSIERRARTEGYDPLLHRPGGQRARRDPFRRRGP